MAPVSPFALIFYTFVAAPASIAKRSELPAMESRDTKPPTSYKPGSGVVDPTTINNNVIFVLFGILGAGCVLTSIWFFFWARNGGCVFRKGDWEDYKSTVLRRKGPNGTILTGATKTTVLGGGSIVGSQGSMSEFGDLEKGEAAPTTRLKKQRRHGRDADMRAYRSEKVARVGGLNREADGAYHDYSTTEGSSLAGAQPAGLRSGGNRETVRPVRTSNPPTRQYSFNAGTEASFSAASEASSHRPLNRHSQPAAPASNNRRSAAPPPRQVNNRHSERASMPGSYNEPLDFDSRRDEASDLGDRNTKAYFHPIPGLASNNGGAGRGFRRGGGGGGRRDSLSDSEGGYTYRS